MLLAHYPSDVAAGLAMGVLIDKTVGRFFAIGQARFVHPSDGFASAARAFNERRKSVGACSGASSAPLTAVVTQEPGASQ